MKTTILILLFLFCLITCRGQNLWVSKTGNDNNTGTFEKPYLTISKAQSVIFDTLFVVGGTYTEYIDRLSFGIGDKQIIISAPPQTVNVTFRGNSFILKDDENVFSVEMGNYQMLTTPNILNTTTVYYNTTVTTYINKSDCPIGYTGSREYYTVVAKLYSSLISQTDAQNKAKADAARNKQIWANQVGICTK